MDKKRTEIESLLFRRRKMEAKFQEIMHLVSGTGEDYTKLIKTQKGNYSKASIDKLVKELIGCIKEYREFEESRRVLRTEGAAGASEVTIDKEENEFLEAYLYLLLGISTYDNTGIYSRYGKPGTWDAFLDRLHENLGYTDVGMLDKDMLIYELYSLVGCFYTECFPSGIFIDISEIFRQVFETDYRSILTKKEIDAAMDFMSKQERKDFESPADLYARVLKEDEEKEQYFREHAEEFDFSEDAEEADPPSTEEEEYEDYASFYHATEENWKKYFEEQERFTKSVMILRKGVTEGRFLSPRFQEEIEYAVHLYLWHHGTSRITDNDVFFTTYAYLKKALLASERFIKESGK